MDSNQRTASPRILVSDFDGTMTRQDFYKLAIGSLLPPDVPDYWDEYRAGTITHFEALRRYFAAIRASEDDVLAIVRRMELDIDLPAALHSLRDNGWDVVVASAGCDWYIRRLLDEAGVSLELHANPGTFVRGEGLSMKMPHGSPFFSPALGVDKTGIVRHYLTAGSAVAFAGDGFPDAEPARLVPGELRFARGDLAELLDREGIPFRPFDRWSEISHALATWKR
jgi:2,3-diketo-5-methylthio-1-phosphopentane phosphatase